MTERANKQGGVMRTLRMALPFLERREAKAPSSWDLIKGSNPDSVVNPRTAENLAAVLACVQAISSGVASLPVWLYRRTETGREEDPNHNLARIIRRGPNPHQTWPDFVEQLVASTLLHGNGLCEVVRDGSGKVAELKPIQWPLVSVTQVPDGRLAYDITETDANGATSERRRLLQDEVLHVKDRSDDGFVGKSRLKRAEDAVSGAIDVNRYSHSILKRGAFPSLAFTFPKSLSDSAYENLKRSVVDLFTGPDNAGRPMLLEQGGDVKTLTMSPEDQELLSSRRFSVEEICRLYQVPPPLICDYTNNTFTNSQQANIWFAQHTLRPWVRKLEAEFERSVFSEASKQTHEIEFDLSGLMRGDSGTRWQNHVAAVNAGILTPNEVRESEGWNPHEAGNELRNPQASGGLTDGN